jgi:type III secretion protein J
VKGRWAAIGAVWLAGCSVPVASGLDEPQANRVVVALDRAGIGAEKEADPVTEGHFRVVVERDEAARAIAAMREEDLPPPETPGVLDSMGKGSIVPSQLAEHAQYVAGLSGELERTLRGIDGVLAARVHLSIPERDPLAEGPPVRPTASVLVKHRGATPPLDPNDVRRLVAGAAPGLAAEDVAVVMLPHPVVSLPPDRELSHLGPITATRGSIGWLRIGVVVSALAYVALLGAVLGLWSRVRKLRAEAAGDESADVPRARAA